MQLLQQFIADRDEDAFATIVRRHGAMVLGVSRGVLRHRQDAEDVFQATFLVLARKAYTIRKHGSLSSWLHGVAYRLALKAKARVGRQREQTNADPFSASTIDDLTMREGRAILHDEIHQLDEKYRASLLLCYWEGKTRDEAAEQLGMSSGAFKKCLERARNLLGSRLARRGLVPSATFFAMLFAENGVQAALPSVLITTTAQAAVAFVTGKSAGVSVVAAAFAEGVMHTMNMTKWATTICAVILLAGLGTGFGLGAFHFLQGDAGARGKAGADQSVQEAKGKAKEAQKPDKERIVGIWRFDKGTVNGEDLPVELKVLGRLQFTKEGELIMTVTAPPPVAGDANKGIYDLVGPGKIDLKMGMKEKDALAIYKFEGNDRLTICANNPDAKERPTEFKAEKDGKNLLFVLVRAKPGEEKPTADEIAKLKGVDRIREAAARTQTTNNFKQIGIAMHNYHDQAKSLPAHAIYSKDGKTPLLSWRVTILPYIEQTDLYNEFKLDEPWDSKHNKKLIAKMPKTYEIPTKAKEGETFLQVITGPDTLFNGAKKMKFTDVTDGLSNTLLVVEAKTPVVWTKPDDVPLPKDKDKRLPVGGAFSNGFIVVMCDGSVRMVPHTIEVPAFRALITPTAGD